MENGNLADDALDPQMIERWRGLLADDADGLSDEDVDRLRRHADVLARVIIDVFLDQMTAQE
jgi:hypothetical protein